MRYRGTSSLSLLCTLTWPVLTMTSLKQYLEACPDLAYLREKKILDQVNLLFQFGTYEELGDEKLLDGTLRIALNLAEHYKQLPGPAKVTTFLLVKGHLQQYREKFLPSPDVTSKDKVEEKEKKEKEKEKSVKSERTEGFEYLNPERLSELAHCPGGVKVFSYSNGRYQVAPNPLNETRAKSARQLYESGHYISYKEYVISRSDFQDPKNWNT